MGKEREEGKKKGEKRRGKKEKGFATVAGHEH